MKKLIYFVLLFPLITYSQNRDIYNLDIARELGFCYDKLTPIEGDPEYNYPLCSDSAVRVFFLEPDYYCVYNEAIGDNKEIRTFDIPKMWGLGTPEDLKDYLENYKA